MIYTLGMGKIIGFLLLAISSILGSIVGAMIVLKDAIESVRDQIAAAALGVAVWVIHAASIVCGALGLIVFTVRKMNE